MIRELLPPVSVQVAHLVPYFAKLLSGLEDDAGRNCASPATLEACTSFECLGSSIIGKRPIFERTKDSQEVLLECDDLGIMLQDTGSGCVVLGLAFYRGMLKLH